MKRRQQTRYVLRARADFSWKDPGGNLQKGYGYTRDISPKAMYVWTDAHPPTGSDIRIKVFLPSLIEGGPPLEMSAKAQVIRVETATPGEPSGGFAAISKTLVLHSTKIVS